jgi:hypothetical protein
MSGKSQKKTQKAMKHYKKECRYCNVEKVCLTCHYIIKCHEITNCMSCGGIYGRPLFTPISAGCILIDYPYIILIFETDQENKLKGTLNDIGGKYDPDKDRNIIDTVRRETKEETGNILFMDGTEPYVDMVKSAEDITYRCYLIDSTSKKRYISTGIIPENPVVKMKITHFLTIPETLLESRLKAIMDSILIYPIPGIDSRPIHMRDYLIELDRIHLS